MGKIIIVTTERRFSINLNSEIVDKDNTRSADFWKRYLLYFDKVVVVCRVNRNHAIESDNYVKAPGIEIFEVTYYHGFFDGLKKLFSLRKRLNSLLNRYEFDYYLLRLPGRIGFIVASILTKKGKNYSVEVVGDPFEVYNNQKGLINKLLARKTRADLRKAVRRAYSVTYVTSRYLQRVYPFRNGFQNYYSDVKISSSFLVKNKEFIEEEPLRLVGIGNLNSPYKGVGLLLDALRILEEKKIPFSLRWIGSGKLLIKYNEFITQYKLQDKVKFLGSVQNSDIPIIFSNSNLFIMPSLQEGLPRAMVEAMASGLICLGANTGGIPELISPDCIFESNNVLAIVQKIEEVRSKFDEFKKYSRMNYNKALEFLPELLEKKHLEFLYSLKNNEE